MNSTESALATLAMYVSFLVLFGVTITALGVRCSTRMYFVIGLVLLVSAPMAMLLLRVCAPTLLPFVGVITSSECVGDADRPCLVFTGEPQF